MQLERRATFVLGGARSGKSSFAEGLIEASGLDAVYLATGRAWDDEMSERIAQHKQRRGGSWTTIEEPLDLVGVLQRECTGNRAVLVDCLTLWLTNLMMSEKDIETETARLVAVLPNSKVPWCSSPMRSASASCRKTAWRATFATMQAGSIKPWQLLRLRSISWRQACRSK